MNKVFFAFIFSIILFQYLCEDTCLDRQNDSEITQAECESLPTLSPAKKCVFKYPGCDEQVKDCKELTTGANAELCSQLTTSATKKCVFTDPGCDEQVKDCNELTTGANAELCSQLTSSATTKKCVLKGTECAEQVKDCNELTTGANAELCSQLPSKTQGKNACYFDGTKCDETNDCEDVTIGATDALCKKLTVTKDIENSLCRIEGTACVEKKKCNLADGKDDSECKNFAVETEGNICKKNPDENNKCKEVKDESAKEGANGLKISLALLISLFLL